MAAPVQTVPPQAAPVKTQVNNKTPGESRAHKRQLELLNEDAKRLCATDIVNPFRHLQDAVDRLLPFHVSGVGSAGPRWLHTSPFFLLEA
jgi:hypothetical protein